MINGNAIPNSSSTPLSCPHNYIPISNLLNLTLSMTYLITNAVLNSLLLAKGGDGGINWQDIGTRNNVDSACA